MKEREQVEVLGLAFDNLSLEEAVDAAMAHIQAHDGAWVVTPNPEIVMLARENPDLAQAVREAALVIPDGIGVIYGARILGRPLRQKLPGIDFASALMDRLAREKSSVFLLGAKPGIAEQAGKALLEAHPGLRICGCHHGYFQDDGPIVEAIRAAKPDLLLVCLGAPKQELWMKNHSEALDVGLMIGLGGSLDVFAGVVQRAPETWQRLGLEWLYRLLKEPRRIGRMMKLPLFLFAVMGQRLFKRT